MRNMLAYLLAKFFILIGLADRAVKQAFKGNYILSIYFHKPSKTEFERCVKWLTQQKFTFLSTDDLYRLTLSNEPIPKGAVVLTVDDGWQSNLHNIVPVAEQYNVPVTIFVSTEPVEQGIYWWSVIEAAHSKGLTDKTVKQLKAVPNAERLAIVEPLRTKLHLNREALTLEQLRQVASSPLITIGAHTVTHPLLNQCETIQVYEEVHQSREVLEKWLGVPVNYFAYPNGNHTKQVVDIVQELNYRLAFTVEPDYLTKQHLLQRYTLPRFEVYENTSFDEAICRMTGVWEPIMLSIRNRFRFNRHNASQAPTKPLAILKSH
jgi:poly-beta-1,6-N-acetyl-D-glucosamine N-deacetylase